MLPLLSSQTVSATLYRLADWLKPEGHHVVKQSVLTHKTGFSTICPPFRTTSPTVAHFAAHSRVPRPSQSRRPLRVVRVMEADQPRSNVGRIVISGCMADVCDELDRLIQKENTRTQ